MDIQEQISLTKQRLESELSADSFKLHIRLIHFKRQGNKEDLLLLKYIDSSSTIKDYIKKYFNRKKPFFNRQSYEKRICLLKLTKYDMYEEALFGFKLGSINKIENLKKAGADPYNWQWKHVLFQITKDQNRSIEYVDWAGKYCCTAKFSDKTIIDNLIIEV